MIENSQLSQEGTKTKSLLKICLAIKYFVLLIFNKSQSGPNFFVGTHMTPGMADPNLRMPSSSFYDLQNFLS